jgi:hypothetical protein
MRIAENLDRKWLGFLSLGESATSEAQHIGSSVCGWFIGSLPPFALDAPLSAFPYMSYY